MPLLIRIPRPFPLWHRHQRLPLLRVEAVEPHVGVELAELVELQRRPRRLLVMPLPLPPALLHAELVLQAEVAEVAVDAVPLRLTVL